MSSLPLFELLTTKLPHRTFPVKVEAKVKFPGFELVSRFCYNKGRILHCSAIFLDELFYWSWSEILTSLKSCGSFFNSAYSSGLLTKLISSLATNITANSDLLIPVVPSSIYGNLADKPVDGVVLMGGQTALSCRGLFWVLRVVSGLGISKECSVILERLIGGMFDQATLDDLPVSGDDGGVYDLNLVLRLVKVLVCEENGIALMKRVGRFIDKCMAEISLDQSLTVSKFLGVAGGLPDSAKDCFDGIYRAIGIYLESHPTLTPEERTKVCRCLNYEKLTLETCKDLAKNRRIPPRIGMEALISQQSKIKSKENRNPDDETEEKAVNGGDRAMSLEFLEKEELRMNLQKMQWRVLVLEKVCTEMKGQMSKMVKKKTMGSLPVYGRAMHRLC